MGKKISKVYNIEKEDKNKLLIIFIESKNNSLKIFKKNFTNFYKDIGFQDVIDFSSLSVSEEINSICICDYEEAINYICDMNKYKFLKIFILYNNQKQFEYLQRFNFIHNYVFIMDYSNEDLNENIKKEIDLINMQLMTVLSNLLYILIISLR